MSREIVVDNFAGGGGASLGIELAGLHVAEACNHDAAAIAMHAANHPATRHWTANLVAIDPRDVVQGRPVGLMWCSPDCVHHSKARGSAPRSKRCRDLAWIVHHWLDFARPRVGILENVEEFRDWGPLDDEGRPLVDLKGFEFQRWIHEFKRRGYRVEYRELRGMDYGSPTTRKRLFVIFRCDGLPIVWPEPTHGPGKLPYRVAAECLDWALPCPSIFDRKKPLQPNTCRRIARGIHRYVLTAAEPFIVPYYGGDIRIHDVGDPLKTISTEGRFGLVAPTLFPITHSGPSNDSNPRCNSVEEPLRTITGANRGEIALAAALLTNTTGHPGAPVTSPVPTLTTGLQQGLVGACLVPRYGERPTQDPRCLSVEQPLPTIVPSGNHGSLVAAFMAQHNRGATGHPVAEPLSTITQAGAQQQLVASSLVKLRRNSVGQDVREPLHTITAGGHFAAVAAFFDKYYRTGAGSAAGEPLPTITTEDRFSLVTVGIAGIEWVLADIGMRMLQPRELFRAQGFPDTWILDPLFNGKPLSKTAQVKCCGNSVCPQVAQVLVAANVQLRDVETEPAAGGDWGELFAEVAV